MVYPLFRKTKHVYIILYYMISIIHIIFVIIFFDKYKTCAIVLSDISSFKIITYTCIYSIYAMEGHHEK